MHPIIFQHSFITLRTSYLLWFVAVSVFMFWTRSRAVNKYGMDYNKTTGAIIWTFFAAVSGALFFDFFGKTLLFFSGNTSFSGFFPAQLSSSGGILCGGLAGIYKSRMENIKWNDFADAAVIPASAAIAIWRLGCFFDGCCRGVPLEGSQAAWFAVHYPGDLEGLYRWPYPLIESAFALALMLFLAAVEKIFFKKKTPEYAFLTPLFILFYGSFRILADPIREAGLKKGGLLVFIFFAIIGLLISIITIYKSIQSEK
ncbi:MAG: hypothetical protein GXZ00_02360 [Synergistaceae bacterium]|nr:hypothetical protein [Synergistaceae bacterium]